MKVVNLSARQFDHYANNHKYRNYYQTSNYANLINRFGYKTEFLGIVNDEQRLIGASLIMYKEVFMSNKIEFIATSNRFGKFECVTIKDIELILYKIKSHCFVFLSVLTESSNCF